MGVTGDLEAARKVNESEAQAYPRAWVSYVSLDAIYSELGEHDKALAAAQKALKLSPGSGTLYANLAINYLNLNRLDEFKAVAEEAQAHHLDSPFLHLNLYMVEFLQHDTPGMQREVAALAGKPGYADAMLYQESDTAAFAGQFGKARDLTRRAAELAERAGQKETAAEYQAEAAVREALAGNPSLARPGRVGAIERQGCGGYLGHCVGAGRRFHASHAVGQRSLQAIPEKHGRAV